MNLVFLGPPGSGKGTQAVRLARNKGIVHLSTGDLLREAVKNGTELGKKAEGYMKAGDLVPDSLIVGLIEDKIAAGDLKSGFILDGFPRTVPQAESLREMLQKNEITLEKAVLIAVGDNEIVQRLSGRWFCPTCQATYNYPANVPKNEGVCDHDGAKLERRPDDEEEVVRNRLEVYKKQTQPIEDFYRNESILTEVKGEQTPDNVFKSILEVVG
ncbi:MAG: adenylate kinase [candidate division Zixibacteria bacterium]|nr:adenylate kinase [candidate division Zixibacteria bacterium]